MAIKGNSQIKTASVTNVFGLMPDGEKIYSYQLSNENGMTAKVISYGATITELKVPSKNGEMIDVVLGFDALESYIKSFDLTSPPYMGATVGRYAGRIHNSTFCLNKQKYILNNNSNNNSLHGGIIGFSQKVWTIKEAQVDKNASVTLTYSSPSGEENYPGNLVVELTYTLSKENELIIEYNAITTEDTVVNLTHHSYFNLNGHTSDVLNLQMVVNSTEILETTKENIPTGQFLKLAHSNFDFSTSKKCPTTIDTTFVLNKENDFAASLFSDKNNLKMSVYTDQPAVHIYVGGNCESIKGKEGVFYNSSSGICFETQNFPDAPNHEHFPNAILKKNKKYQHKTRYKFEIQ